MFKVTALAQAPIRRLAHDKMLCMPYSIGCFFCDSGHMKNKFNLDFLTTIQKIVNPHLTGIQNIHESTYLTFDKEILIDLNNPLEENQDLTLLLLSNSNLNTNKSCLIFKIIDESSEVKSEKSVLHHCIFLKEEKGVTGETMITIEDTANTKTLEIPKDKFSNCFMTFINQVISKKSGDFRLSMYQFIPNQDLLTSIEDEHARKRYKQEP
jgi:hypothetical protein